MINLYDLDENGNKIKVPRKIKYKKVDGTVTYYPSYTYRARTVGLHRVLWAWKYGRVPYGYVVDHKNNHHTKLEDYRYDNLECITQAENLAKDLDGHNTRIVKTSPKRDMDFYVNKLNKAIELYEQAKREHNAEMAHRQRSLISLQKAKIRYLLGKGNDRDVEETELH